MSNDVFDSPVRDIRRLTPQQWTMLRRQVVAQAQEERKRVMRDIAACAFLALHSLFALALAAIGVVRDACRRVRQRQRRHWELHELSQLDDLALKDIGISRLDIRAMRLNTNHGAPGRERLAPRGH